MNTILPVILLIFTAIIGASVPAPMGTISYLLYNNWYDINRIDAVISSALSSLFIGLYVVEWRTA